MWEINERLTYVVLTFVFVLGLSTSSAEGTAVAVMAFWWAFQLLLGNVEDEDEDDE